MGALIEPFFYCLLASMIWAPLIFIGASLVTGKNADGAGAGGLSGKVWPVALMLATLPVLVAPLAATFGLSLRAPAPLPPMSEAVAIVATDAVSANPYYVEPSAVSLADVLRTAAVLYFYGFVLLLILAAARHIWFAYRLNFAAPLDEPALENALEEWRVRIGVTKRPRYVFSHIVSSVCVYGVVRPVVVMPFNLLDRVSIEDAALMGAHEMAHIKRGDVALFALCSVAKAVFWFNPFMHQICARANLAAEQGADALVLARGVNRRQYAHCFVQGLRLAANARYGSFAGELIPSFTPFDKRSRRQRLDAILSGAVESNRLTLASKLGLGASAAIAAALAVAQAAFAVAPPSVREALPVSPVEGEVSLNYGEKSDLIGKDRAAHEGIDIRAARGEIVRASGAGKVIEATDKYRGAASWGKVVVIDHGHGLLTRYAHLDSFKVRKGDRVSAGDAIGAVGSTGVSSGPHLHFEVISDGKTVDPAPVAAPQAAATPKASASVRRSVQVSPVPAAAVTVVASASAETDSENKSKQKQNRTLHLEDKKARLEERMRQMFEDFDAFSEMEGKRLQFNELELDGFNGAQQFAEMFDGKEFPLSDFSFNTDDFQRMYAGMKLSSEDMEAFNEQRELALEAAAEAMERAREEIAEVRQAQIEAQYEMKERARERKLAEKERDRALRQANRERDAALREAERERERVVKEWETELESMLNEEEMLALRAEAAREAQQELERELAEIERRRQEIRKTAERSN